MFKPLSIYLAFRYIRSKQGNGFASFIAASSTIGIALGVIVLIVGLSAMNGFEKALKDHLLSVVPHSELVSAHGVIPNWAESIKQLQLHPEVVAAAPFIKTQGMVQKGEQLKGVEFRGVDVLLEQQVSALPNYIVAGKWQHLTQENSVVLGVGVAKKLGVSVGDTIQMLLASNNRNTDSDPNKISNSNSVNKVFSSLVKRNLTVVGLFKFAEVDNLQAYVSLSLAADLLNYQQQQAQGIRLTVSDAFLAPRIAQEATRTLNDYVYLYNWTHTQGHLYNDIQLVRMVMYIALALVIAVASFNIVSTLIMAVNEKQGDIAILKTMGAGSPVVMFTFMLQGLINGVLGCVVGGVIGVYLASNLTMISQTLEQFFSVKFLAGDVYFIDYLPSHVIESDVTTTIIIALIMSLLATVYPAWRATKVEPAQVLGQL